MDGVWWLLSFAGLVLVWFALQGLASLGGRVCWRQEAAGLVFVRGVVGVSRLDVSGDCRQRVAVFLFALGRWQWCGWTCWLGVRGGGTGVGFTCLGSGVGFSFRARGCGPGSSRS